MHLAIAFDQNYLKPFQALVASILASTRNIITFHLIATGISIDERERIKSKIHSKGSNALFYSLDEQSTKGFILSNKWTVAVYYRLFFPLIIPKHIDRLLYLDTDTIVLKDLTDLYYADLGEYPVGAVYDNYVCKQPLIGIEEEGQYFNSGVLLIDVHKWRNEKISEHTMNYLREHPENIRYVDQCALNAVLRNRWKKLHFRFNVLFTYIPFGLTKAELRSFIEDKYIVHFTLERPWEMLCKNRLRYLFFNFLGESTAFRSDFQWKRIPAWTKIRLTELYFDLPFVQKIWRTIKYH